MDDASPLPAGPVRVGLVGAGRIGTLHAGSLARRIPGAALVAVADPAPGAADRVATALGARATTDPAELLADPGVEAVARALAASGYTGTVGLEAWASGDSVVALDRFRSAFTPVPEPAAPAASGGRVDLRQRVESTTSKE
jgi:predicted homoserine dehydrogenase-like protein